MTPTDIEALAFTHIPEAYFRRALTAVFQAHKNAWDDSRANYHEQEAENLRPYQRRAKLEGYLRDAAALVPGVEAAVVKGDASGWWHTEIRGGPVVMTESAVPTPGAMVTESGFRNSLAQDNQGVLFGADAEADHLYVLLLHSRSRAWKTRGDALNFGHLPGSAYLAFPAPGLRSYVHSINLYERYPDIVESHLPSAWNEEAKVSYIWHARRAAWA